METKYLSIDDYRELIRSGECVDPIVILETVASGNDPRQHSEIYKKALEIHEFSDGAPDSTDWAELFDLITNTMKYKAVSISESAAAARTLMEYLHSKKKPDETGGGGASGDYSGQVELNDDQVILVKEIFREEF